MARHRSPLLAELAKLRDGYRCVQCDLNIELMLEVDHIIPLVDGGSDTLDNLQTLCWLCHDRKTRQENVRRENNRRFPLLSGL